MWEVVCDKNGSYTLLLSFIFRIYSFFYQRMVAVKMGKINQDTGVTKCLHFFGDFFFFLQFLKVVWQIERLQWAFKTVSGVCRWEKGKGKGEIYRIKRWCSTLCSLRSCGRGSTGSYSSIKFHITFTPSG